MIVAVIAVLMMQVAVYEIIHVVAVWHTLMAAVRPMHVCLIVSATLVRRGAEGLVCRPALHDMVVNMVPMHVVHVSIMQIVGMGSVLNRSVAAIRAVLVAMARVFGTVLPHAVSVRPRSLLRLAADRR